MTINLDSFVDLIEELFDNIDPIIGNSATTNTYIPYITFVCMGNNISLLKREILKNILEASENHKTIHWRIKPNIEEHNSQYIIRTRIAFSDLTFAETN